MKKNNTLKVLLIAILFTALLTWILPITYFNGSLASDARFPAGIFDILGYPLGVLPGYFISASFYILLVGAFYGVFEKTGAYRKVCDKLAKTFKGKEILFYATVVTILSVIVAFCGFSYELIFVLPLLASVILLMGHDRITVALTLIGSIAVGMIGSLFGSAITGAYIDTINQSASTTLSYTGLIWIRVAILILGIALLTFNIIWRLKKKDIKKDEDKELLAQKVEVKSRKGKKRAIWPAIVIFDLILILMIFGSINFSGAFKVTIFDTFNENVMAFKIWDYDIFAKILGSSGLFSGAIGTWNSLDFSMFIILGTIILAIMYRIKPNEIFESYKEGAKKFGLAALLMYLAYTVLVLASNHPIVLTIVKPLMEITNGFNAITLAASTFITSIFFIDPYYTASAILPYAVSVIQDTAVYPLIVFISQAMQGLVLLIAPTSIVLLGITSYLKVSYTEWIKNIWKIFLELLLLCFVAFIAVIIFKLV